MYMSQTLFSLAKKPLISCITLAASLISLSVKADVYIGIQNADEIVISSFPQDEGQYVQLIDSEALSSNIPILGNNTKHLPYHDEVMIAAAATTLEPALIHAVITVESHGNASAVSSKGAYGLMQLMPATAKRFNVKNQKDPQQNILAGAQYLRELKDLYRGNLSLMLAAYNAGPKAVEKYHGQIPPYLETQLYVPKVLKFYHKFSIKS